MTVLSPRDRSWCMSDCEACVLRYTLLPPGVRARGEGDAREMRGEREGRLQFLSCGRLRCLSVSILPSFLAMDLLLRSSGSSAHRLPSEEVLAHEM